MEKEHALAICRRCFSIESFNIYDAAVIEVVNYMDRSLNLSS